LNLKILFIIPTFPPQTGGAATSFDILINGIKQNKNIRSIVLLTRYSKNVSIFYKEKNLFFYRILIFRQDDSIFKYFLSLLNYLIVSMAVPIIILKHKINIIHYHPNGVWRVVQWITKYFNIPTIVHKGDLGKDFPRGNSFDKVISISENTYKFLIKNNIPSQKIISMPMLFIKPIKLNSRKLLRIKEKYRLPEKYLVFSGRLNHKKGIYNLLESFMELSNKEDIFLVLVGKNLIQNKLYNFMKTNKRILYFGEINQEDLYGIIQMSELLVLPSKSEGLPRVCLEAISLGTKFLCSNIVPELNRYCPNFVFEIKKPGSLEKKILSVLKSDEKPSYPFEIHNKKQTINSIINLYTELMQQQLNK